MSKRFHAKSGLFLMELLINLLLFCLLCGCGLLFFIKSNNLINSATTLHHATAITSSIASLYETGDGSLDSIYAAYATGNQTDSNFTVYLNKEFEPCPANEKVYYVTIQLFDDMTNKICIDFYSDDDTKIYTINACNYTPYTPEKIKEVTGNE